MNCRLCATEFHDETDYSLLEGMGFKPFKRTLCDPCSEKEHKDKERAHTAFLNQQHEERWNAICPKLYRGTNPELPGLSAACVDAVRRWDYRSGVGMGFTGESGTGKTRLMFLALRKGFDQGLACRFMTHNQFSKLVIDAFSGEMKAEQRKQLDFLGKVQLLFLDDLGKAPSTERTDAELEELIEIRGANMIPTLWTANGHGEWLIKRFGPDRGDALVRRLAEFSTVVKA